MEIILGTKGSGKSTKLLDWVKKNSSHYMAVHPMVVHLFQKYLMDNGGNKEQIISYHDIERFSVGRVDVKIMIDDIDYYFSTIYFNIEGFSCNIDEIPLSLRSC